VTSNSVGKRAAAGLATAVAALLGIFTAASAPAGAVPSATGELDPDRGAAAARQGSYLAAERLLRRAVAAAEDAHGPDHPGLAAPLGQLAALHQAAGRWAAAEPLLKRALALDAKARDPEHPEHAGRLNNLAVLYRATGRPAAARLLFVRALAILGARLPLGHPALAAVRGNYADLLVHLGRPEEAAALRAQAEASRRRHEPALGWPL
jgi:tetratricopeptide (TPR) repeat protein